MQDFDHGLPENKYNFHAWITGDPKIGENVWIGAFCVIDALHNTLKIGRGTNIASGAQILTHTSVKRCISEKRYGVIDSKSTEIGEFCFIGTNAVVLMGSKIGDHSVIGAGAVVSEDTIIPAYSVVIGAPARVVGSSKKYLKDVERESISVVMPAYNEIDNIEKVIHQVLKELEKITKDYEVVVVDDGSDDGTGELVDKISSKNRKVRVVHHPKNKGFTGAILSCYKSAKKHLIFLAPADGEFDFSELRNFVDEIKGYDVAVGYRIDNTRSFVRKINSKAFHFLCNILFDIKLREISAVIMWRKPVLSTLSINSSEGSAMIEPEIISQALKKGYKFKEVPFHYLARKAGKSKGTNLKMIVKTLIEMFKFWWKQKFG